MKILFLLLWCAAPSLLVAQDPVQQFFSKYAGKPGFTSVQVSGGMLGMLASSDEEDLSAFREVTAVQILVTEEENPDSRREARAMTGEIFPALQKGYTELLSVKEFETDLRIVARSVSNHIVTDLLIVGQDDGQFVFVNVVGRMDLRKLEDLDIDIDGLEKLDDIGLEELKE